MDKILIFDDFFSDNILTKIRTIIHDNNWNPGSKNSLVINYFYFPNNRFFQNNPDETFWRMELSFYDLFSYDLKYIIEEKLGKKLFLSNIYAVSQAYQENSNFHIDCNKNNSYTFCFYIDNFEGFAKESLRDSRLGSSGTPTKPLGGAKPRLSVDDENYENEDLDGNLYIKIPDEKHILSISPNNNRAVFFPSNYIHRGTAFSKKSSNLRICIAWKFIEI